MLKCYFVSFLLNEEAEIVVSDFKQPAPKDIATLETNSFILQCCIEVNPDLEPSICLFILDSSHSQITDLINLNRNERWKLGEGFVTVFLERLVLVLVDLFSVMLWEQKILVCPKSLSQEDGLKEGQKLFQVVVTLFISSALKFCCTDSSTEAE